MTSPKRAITDLQTGERIYIGVNPNDRYYSVTNVLSALPKQQFLIPWAAKCVAENAAYVVEDLMASWPNCDYLSPYVQVADEGYLFDTDEFAADLKHSHEWERDDAGDIGDEVHDAADKILTISKGNPRIAEAVLEEMELDTPALKRIEGLIQFLHDNVVLVEATEFTIYNDSHGYAGSCDIAAYVNDIPRYLDIKSGKNVYADTALQLTAYSRGDYIVPDDKDDKLPMPFVGVDRNLLHGGVLHLTANRCKLIDYDISDEMFDCFLSLMLVKRLWLDGGSKEAKGKVLYDSSKVKAS